jgi:hypothetical protein
MWRERSRWPPFLPANNSPVFFFPLFISFKLFFSFLFFSFLFFCVSVCVI